MSLCLLPIFPVSSFQFFFFNVFSTLGRGHKVWRSKCSLPFLAAFQKKQALNFWGFLHPSNWSKGAFATARSGRNGGSGAECPSTSESSGGDFLLVQKLRWSELVEDWMDWNLLVMLDNDKTQDAWWLLTTQVGRLTTCLRIFGIPKLPNLRCHEPASSGELVGDCWDLGEAKSLVVQWKLA